MLQINADHFVEAGRRFEGLKQLCLRSPSTMQFNREDMQDLRGILSDIKNQCRELQLATTGRIVDDFLSECSVSHIYVERLKHETHSINSCFRSELQSKLFFYIPIERASYYSDGLAWGQELQPLYDCLKDKFPNALGDLYEAGNCFAVERYTACIAHLSKVVEFGLVSFAHYAGVEEKYRRNWNKVLEISHSYLRDGTGVFQSISHQDKTYFAEVIGLLRNFKVAWRNPASHISASFNESKARGLFAIAKSTMDHLVQRLSQVTVPQPTEE